MQAPQAGGGGIVSGIMGSIAQGFMFGTGSAVAHRAVDSVMGPRTVVHEHKGDGEASNNSNSAPAPVSNINQNDTLVRCDFERTQFRKCMTNNNDDIDACRSFMDSLSGCQASYRGMN